MTHASFSGRYPWDGTREESRQEHEETKVRTKEERGRKEWKAEIRNEGIKEERKRQSRSVLVRNNSSGSKKGYHNRVASEDWNGSLVTTVRVKCLFL